MFVENVDPIVAMGIGRPITKDLIRDFLKHQLSTNSKWALKALIKIFEYQTEFEKQEERTRENNNVGFTGVDAEILTSFAKQYQERGFLSNKQMILLFKKIPKYWSQIAKISDPEKLRIQIAQSLIS